MIAVDYIPGSSAKRLRVLGESVGLSAQEMGWEEMRLSVNSAIKFTYPRKKADGARAIDRDLAKVFWATDGKTSSTSDMIVRTFKAGDKYTGVETGKGAIVFVETTKYLKGTSASKSTLNALHQNNRSGRTGKTRFVRSTKDGKRDVVGRTLVKGSNLRSYAASVRKRIGTQKAGWVPAGDHFSMKARAGQAKAASWIRGGKKLHGSYKDTIRKSGNGKLVAINSVPYWSDKKRVPLEKLVQGIAQKRLDRTVPKKLDNLVERFNAGKGMAA